MADYIPRKAALDLAYWHGEKATVDNPNPDGVDAVDVSDIEAIPAADVVEVVRCKDCKYHREPDKDEQKYLCQGALVCANADFLYDGWNTVWPDDFCSYGRGNEQ